MQMIDCPGDGVVSTSLRQATRNAPPGSLHGRREKVKQMNVVRKLQEAQHNLDLMRNEVRFGDELRCRVILGLPTKSWRSLLQGAC